MPDLVLQRIAAGDPSAVEDCLAQYGGLVWSLARRFSGDHTEAEDAVQEVFIEIWRSADRFDPEVGSESTFISMIARRRLVDRYRKRTRRVQTAEIQEGHATDSSTHERHAEIQEEADRARKQMQALRPEERKVLELSIDQGLSQAQIADVTNLPLGTVKTHARRGLIRLREMLAAED